jgi:hypothetical protein
MQKAVFRDTLTFKNDRPIGVFQLGEEAKKRGEVAVNAYSHRN